MVDKTKIDLACGSNKMEGFFGIDVVAAEGIDLVHDLNVYPWPIESNSVKEIHCHHYMEHIPHDSWRVVAKSCETFEEFKAKASEPYIDGVLKFMDELYRILEPGGKAHIQVPHAKHSRAYGDPTHVRYMLDWSFYYFNKEWRDLPGNEGIKHYDINCDFDMVFSYHIDESLILKSDEVRSKAFKEDWDSILDLKVELTKRK